MGYKSILNSPAFSSTDATFVAMLSTTFKTEIYDHADYLFPLVGTAYNPSIYAGANTLTMATSAAVSLAALYLY
jgi:hypothetical protein